MNDNLPVVKPENTMVVPGIGSLVNLEDLKTCAHAIDDLRALKHKIDEALHDLQDAFIPEMQLQGSKTLHYDYIDVTMSGGESVSYDQEILTDLLEAGLPAARYDALVKTVVTYRVDAREIARLEKANTRYREIIERARTVHPKPWTASVKIGKDREAREERHTNVT
jgi:hypothetical protein